MPTNIKLVLSLIVAAAAVAVHFFQAGVGQEFNSWLALALGAFMIFAMWLFPEAKGKKQKGER